MTYVISDIHGEYKAFMAMLKKINFSDNDTLYVLGDCIDRGPDGVKLLLYIKNHEKKNIHLLLGNHELLMLNFFRYPGQPDAKNLWFSNGGGVTYTNLEYSYSPRTKNALIKYISALPVQKKITINGTNFILCHNLPETSEFENNPMDNPYIWAHYRNDTEFSVWCRSAIGEEDQAFSGVFVVHGHTPSSTSMIKTEPCSPYGTWINIDCAAAYGGNLGCLCLDDMTEYYISPE